MTYIHKYDPTVEPANELRKVYYSLMPFVSQKIGRSLRTYEFPFARASIWGYPSGFTALCDRVLTVCCQHQERGMMEIECHYMTSDEIEAQVIQ